MQNELIRIGTRTSNLAIAQTKLVIKKLESLGCRCEIVGIKTSGDRIRSRISDHGGKVLFTKQIEEHLLKKNIHIAVHSLKDIPAFIDDKLSISCTLERSNPNDVLISKKFKSILDLSKNTIIGTSSFRREVFLNKRCKIIPIRGNIETRIQKTEMLDGIVIAQAGVERLKCKDYISNKLKMHYTPIGESLMIPAPGQGTIAVQCRKDNIDILELLKKISDQKTMICSIAERSFLKFLNADCTVPMASHAFIKDNTIYINSMLNTKNGTFFYKTQGNIQDASFLGTESAKKLSIDAKYIK